MDYVITKFGNYGKIYPIPEGILAATLDKYLQYERQGKQFMPNPEWARVCLYKKKTGVFPWGLLKTVERVMDKYCVLHQHSFKITYMPLIGEVPESMAVTLRDYQKEAIAALIKHHGGIICLPTGAGKTIMIIEYLKLMNLHSLVIVPTIDIRKQWQDYGVPNMIVSTYQNPRLKDKEYIGRFNILVFDECHHVSAKSLYTLAMKTKTDTVLIGISASPTREDGEDMKINAALGEIVYHKPRRELIRQGWIANAKVYYLKPEFTDTGRYMDYQQVYLSQIVNNAHRNKLIISTALKEWRNGRKILILVSHIGHGDKLIMEALRQIQDQKIIPVPEVVFMNGKSKDRAQDMRIYDIIIATPIYDEGYDLPALDCLILAGSGKSEIKLVQRVGRILRPKPDGRPAIIYDCADSIKYIKGHYLKRRRLLAEEFEIIDSEDQQSLLAED